LRALAGAGRLVCPGCGQLLRFRVGEQRRPHFAHRKWQLRLSELSSTIPGSPYK
jgi:competence CoiA-like predicted nuclease